MPHACIFDLDGTLANTLASIALTANRVLEHYGLPSQPVDHFRYFAGDGGRVLLERCFQATGGDPALLDEAEQLFRQWFAENPLEGTTHYDGLPETLRVLKDRGFHLAVCTNKPHTAAVGTVEGLFGPDLFDAIQGQTPEIPRKPSPDSALLLARRMGVAPEDCLYIGDTNTDMDTGRSAGMYTIGVLWGFRTRAELEEHHAHLVVERPEQLLDAAARLEKGILRFPPSSANVQA